MKNNKARKKFTAPQLTRHGRLEELTLVPQDGTGCWTASGKVDDFQHDACDRSSKS